MSQSSLAVYVQHNLDRVTESGNCNINSPGRTTLQPQYSQHQSLGIVRSRMSRGGFNCEFTFEPLECQMCHKYLRDPQTASCCGKNFCKTCIKQVQGNCSVCSEALVYHPYTKFAEVLLQFTVNCTHECGWSGPLKEHDKHLNIDPLDQTWLDGCPKVVVKCIFCKTECKPRQDYLQCMESEFQSSKLSRIYDITCFNEVCNKWEVIGQELSLRDSMLHTIKTSYDINDPKDFYHKMLKCWIESTNLPNWRKLLCAFRKPASNLKTLAGKIEQGNLNSTYSTYQAYQTLTITNIILQKASRLLGLTLTHVHTLCIIILCTGLLCDMATEQQVTQLMRDAEDLKQKYRMQQARPHQLADVKDQTQTCLQSLKEKIEDLKFEENVKLREQSLEKNTNSRWANSGMSLITDSHTMLQYYMNRHIEDCF